MTRCIGGPGTSRLKALTLAASFGILLVSKPALSQQYQVYQWANFDEGRLPTAAAPFGGHVDENLSVIDFDTAGAQVPGFRDPAAARETGKYGLKLTANPNPADAQTYISGLAFGTILDREKLGATGKALYQADFFLPGNEPEVPSVAVLAMEPPEGVKAKEGGQTGALIEAAPNTDKKNPRSFYRFGLTLGKYLYFSCVRPTQTTATIYVQDGALYKRIPRPGWHRFALVFAGPKTIRCYVDGLETSFSPLQDDSLLKLQVGIMLADNKRKYDAYVDNLSIQLSTEDAPIPKSPYAYLWKETTGSTGTAVANTPPGGITPTDSVWQGDAVAAWNRAKQENKPFLLYFYAPANPGSEKLSGIFDADPKAKEFLAKHICARIDVNQLQGGTTAAGYQIFKVPTLLIFTPDGKSTGRATFNRDDTWDSFVAKLGG